MSLAVKFLCMITTNIEAEQKRNQSQSVTISFNNILFLSEFPIQGEGIVF